MENGRNTFMRINQSVGATSDAANDDTRDVASMADMRSDGIHSRVVRNRNRDGHNSHNRSRDDHNSHNHNMDSAGRW
jgi:hypothetical protein